jgi:chromosome segregation ATPase
MSLEKELSFYQGQAMEAMRARDSATADADQLRTAHVALQRDSDETQVQLNHLRQCNSSLEGRVEQLGAELQAAQKQAHKVPGLQKELSASKAHAEQLAAKLADAQVCRPSALQSRLQHSASRTARAIVHHSGSRSRCCSSASLLTTSPCASAYQT